MKLDFNNVCLMIKLYILLMIHQVLIYQQQTSCWVLPRIVCFGCFRELEAEWKTKWMMLLTAYDRRSMNTWFLLFQGGNNFCREISEGKIGWEIFMKAILMKINIVIKEPLQSMSNKLFLKILEVMMRTETGLESDLYIWQTKASFKGDRNAPSQKDSFTTKQCRSAAPYGFTLFHQRI